MSEFSVSEARKILATVVDSSLGEPVYLTRRERRIAAIVSSELLERLLEDAEELADIKAVDEAWDEADLLDEVPIPWEDAKRDLGL